MKKLLVAVLAFSSFGAQAAKVLCGELVLDNLKFYLEVAGENFEKKSYRLAFPALDGQSAYQASLAQEIVERGAAAGDVCYEGVRISSNNVLVSAILSRDSL